MTPADIALARRAVACKGWRWMPGMLHGMVVGDKLTSCYRIGDLTLYLDADRVPDLADPATLGCLLALVREAWRCPTVYVRQSTTRRKSDGVIAWEVCDLHLDAEACRALGVPREGSVGFWGHGSEAEALIAALEAAP